MSDNVDVKDAADVVVPIATVDKTGAGNGELQLVGIDYGAGTARAVLTEKPATAALQGTANAALGAPADAEASAGDGTIVALLKRARTLLGTIASALAGTLTVDANGSSVDATGSTVAVANFPASQAVSGTVAVANFPASQAVSGTVAVSNFPATQPVSGTVIATGPLTDGQLRATAVPVSAAALPLPAGAATETSLAALLALNPALLTTPPAPAVSAPPVRPVGQKNWTCSFAAVGASVLSSDLAAPIVGTGVGYSQAGGSLLITTGTTTNAEFLTRSILSFVGAMRMRASIVASQRIVNQNLQVTLADLIGEGLSYSIVSATVVDVAKTAHGYTAQNVGQFMNLAGITGAAGVPGRYAIASIPDANTIRFTVAGWPGSGSGTLTLFGWNFSRNLVNGTTATNIAYDCQRRGWASGDTTATINTTASPGTIIQNDLNGRDAFLMDALRATATIPTFATRASRYENIPDDDVPLYVWIWSYNGTTAPASTTTWTLGFVAVEDFANQTVYLQGIRANGAANALPVNMVAPATLPVSLATNTPTIAAGTAAIGDVGQQYRANATGAASRAHLVSAASTNATVAKASAGRLLGWYFVNTNAAVRYVKLHNQATAPTAGTGVVQTIAIPPNGVSQFKLEGGIAFATGIAFTTTTGAADGDTAAVGANDIVGDLFYA